MKIRIVAINFEFPYKKKWLKKSNWIKLAIRLPKIWSVIGQMNFNRNLLLLSLASRIRFFQTQFSLMQLSRALGTRHRRPPSSSRWRHRPIAIHHLALLQHFPRLAYLARHRCTENRYRSQSFRMICFRCSHRPQRHPGRLCSSVFCLERG